MLFTNMLIRTVLRSIDGINVVNMWQWLTDRLEEEVHVGLHPATVQLDDRDRAFPSQPAWPLVGVAEIGNRPRPRAPGSVRRQLLPPELEIGMTIHPLVVASICRRGHS